MGKVGVHVLLQPVSQSRGWQVESSPRVPSVVKLPRWGVRAKGLTGNPCFILAQVLPPRLQAPCGELGGWDGAGCLAEREGGSMVGTWWERAGGALDGSADKKLFEVKRKDQINALKNLIELNDVNQQYKIIDIMLKGLFKVSYRTGRPLGWACRGAGEGGQEKRGGPGGLCGVKEKS